MTKQADLPRTAARPMHRPSERTNDGPLPRHEATVLVVDDDCDVRELAISCLETLGYQALAVEGGRAAIEMVDKNSNIDMMLIDVAMPEMNGVEAVAEILKRRPSTPFLYMTGYVGPTKLDPAEHRV